MKRYRAWVMIAMWGALSVPSREAAAQTAYSTQAFGPAETTVPMAEYHARVSLAARGGAATPVGLLWISLGALQAGMTAEGFLDLGTNYQLRPYGYALAGCHGLGGLVLFSVGVASAATFESVNRRYDPATQPAAYRAAWAKVQMGSGTAGFMSGAAIVLANVLIALEEQKIVDQANASNRDAADDSSWGSYYMYYQLTPGTYFPAVLGGTMVICGLVDMIIGGVALDRIKVASQSGVAGHAAPRRHRIRWGGLQTSWNRETLWVGTSIRF